MWLERAGVSIATVSRAVNHIPTVNAELAKRVWEAIEEVGYLPNTQARALVSGRSRMLGLIVSEITNPFFPELVQEFENLAVAQGYEVLIGSTNYEPARTESLIRRMLQRNVDGVAVMTFGIEEELVQKLVEREFPLVFVDAGPDLPNIRVLKVDYGEGIRQGVQHLAALGHRHIAFISGPLRLRSAVARRDAFLKSMAELGLTVPAEHMVEGQPHHGRRHRRHGALILALGELPTGVMCSNDMTAIGVLHALYRTPAQGTCRYLGGGIRRHPSGAVHAASAHHGANVLQAILRTPPWRDCAQESSRITWIPARKSGVFPLILWFASPLRFRAAVCLPWSIAPRKNEADRRFGLSFAPSLAPARAAHSPIPPEKETFPINNLNGCRAVFCNSRWPNRV